MKDYEKRNEELLKEMVKLEEIKNKKIIAGVLCTTIVSMIFYIGIILVSVLIIEKGFLLGAVIVAATTLLLITLFYSFKLENETGYQECKECHHRFTPTYFTSLVAPHLFTTRYLKCPKCNKRTWTKKVMTK